MFKILQARLQRHFSSAAALHCFSSELRTSRSSRGFEEESEIKLPTFTGSWRKQQSSRKTSASPSWTSLKPLTLDHRRLRRILKDMGVPDYLSCFLRNLYLGQEATVRTGHGTMDWFKIGKGVQQGYILSLCVCNLYAAYIMRNARVDESQAGIKIARRNINHLRHADDTILMAEGKEELKSLLIR